jgi:hypothetical protein
MIKKKLKIIQITELQIIILPTPFLLSCAPN